MCQAPPVFAGVLNQELIQEGSHFWFGRGREAVSEAVGKIASRREQAELAVSDGGECGCRGCSRRIELPAGAALLPYAGMSEVGQKQLLSEPVGCQQVSPTSSCLRWR